MSLGCMAAIPLLMLVRIGARPASAADAAQIAADSAH